MAKLLQSLIPFLSSLALFFMMANSQIDFHYDSFAPDSPDLTYQGDAFVPSGSSFLRLTKTAASGTPEKTSAGRVVYNIPVPFWEPGRRADFETTIKFSITPIDDNPADGIAFFMAPVGTTIPSGATGGELGIFDSTGNSSSLFAIEFDVYVNPWDPSYRHIGVDINSVESKKHVPFNNSLLRQEVTADIEYVEATKTITVKIQTAGSERKTVLTYDETDLSTILEQEVQVGISASTGLYVALHDIHTWYFHSTFVNTVTSNSNSNSNAGIRQVV